MMKLDQAVALVEKASIESQRLLRRILYETLYRKKLPVVLRPGEDPEELVALGLCVCVDDPAGVISSPDLEKVRRKVYSYLGRRNEVDVSYDENMKEIEIPKGAQFAFVMNLLDPSDTYLGVEFPDDDVTRLLDLHGVNRCRGWRLKKEKEGK